MQRRRNATCWTALRGRAARAVGAVLGLGVLGGGAETAAEEMADAELRRVRVQHVWVKDVALGGMFYAMDSGLYREQGLEVEIVPGGPGLDPVFPVTSGDAEIGIHANAGSVLLPRSQGVPIVVVASQYKSSPLGFLAKASTGAGTAEGLRGKRIGTVKTSLAVVKSALELAGLGTGDYDLQVISPANSLGLLLEDRLDVLVAFKFNQKVQLDLRGQPNTFILLDDLGYKQEAYPFFVSEEFLAREPDTIRAFLAATRRGWEHALAHPEEVARLVVARYADGQDLDHSIEFAKLQGSLMESDLTRERGLFYMDAEKWKTTARLMRETGQLEAPVDLDETLNWEFLR